jgi:hypothetical protein
MDLGMARDQRKLNEWIEWLAHIRGHAGPQSINVIVREQRENDPTGASKEQHVS